MRPSVYLVDNFDSFAWNLFQALSALGARVEVVRSNRATAGEALKRDRVLLSPGPCGPAEAGRAVALARAVSGKRPVLGVCLGHQILGHAFGGRVARAPRPVHGRTSPVIHTGAGAFRGMPSPFPAARYHSLAVTRIPPGFERTAWTPDGVLMGMRRGDLEGWQFHPESYLTECGIELLRNWLRSEARSRKR
ncbi:MAG: aminodeoxychorismate/anthranilate synthase component II [Planctomycetia bacterium]|nr:aminodeoxychorismate/anthranilate synthase component II [Planctomycetia bacterium]